VCENYYPMLRRAGRGPAVGTCERGELVEYGAGWGDGEVRPGYGFTEEDISAQHVGPIHVILPLYPNLERLAVHGNYARFGDALALPALRELEIVTSSLTRDNIASIVASSLPHLERCVVWFGDSQYGGECTVDDALAIASWIDARCPDVHHLGLVNTPFTDQLCQALATKHPALLGR